MNEKVKVIYLKTNVKLHLRYIGISNCIQKRSIIDFAKKKNLKNK